MKLIRKVGLAFLFSATVCGAADEVTLIDFTQPGHGWKGNPRTGNAVQQNGFSLELTGDDPWLEGPAVAIPGFGRTQKMALTLEAECERPGDIQIFYAPGAGQGFSPEHSDWLRLPRGGGTQYRGLVPVLSEKMRFRLDPPGSAGRVTVRALRATPLVPLTEPVFEKPVGVSLAPDSAYVKAGVVGVAHDRRWNAFACFVDGKKMAESNPDETLAYWDGTKTVPVRFTDDVVVRMLAPNVMAATATARDAGGATWRVRRRFTAGEKTVLVMTSVEVDAPREVVHLPWMTLFFGVGTFGEQKHQALLPGVEYLENEPSSSEKEIKGAAANRRLADGYKVCYPMMALTAEGSWFSMDWESGPVAVSPLFDSPDRVFHSGGHVMGVWSPAVGDARFESELAVYKSVKLEAGETYACAVTLAGGRGEAVTEAVGAYVARKGLPPLPKFEGGFDGAVRLLAAGWLDSKSRQGLLWRHAVWENSFQPARAEDVPGYLLWLAANTSDAALKARLRETAQAAIAELPAGCFGIYGISHVQRPTGALVYGDLADLARQSGKNAARLAEGLKDGRAHYTPQKGKPDYGSTLGGDHCNGFTSLSAETMLVQASLSGDEAAIAAALAVLDKMTALYAGQVPRGAQPWEMPLHTPDIVASGRLVHCYVLGFLLSGRAEHLEQARYWAWTGVTMLYLTQPVDGAVGRYATIGVIGATDWQAPNWIGQPVQWCGLVYRSALEDLARVDGERRELWQTLARGMTITGLQMCFPIGDPDGRGGLMPDFFLLRQQVSDGPAINPGTVQAHLGEAYGKTPMYNVVRLANGSLAHVPGSAEPLAGLGGTSPSVAIKAWPEGECRILVTRLAHAPKRVTWNGQTVAHRYLEDAHSAIVPITGEGLLSVEE